MNDTGHLGRKLDDSLPDFVTFVVSRFLKWGKKRWQSADYRGSEAKNNDKKTRQSGFFRKLSSAEAEYN
ncbi:TPA: hypothetical protein M5K54_002155 [Citrobacter freundii]|nr:hypothetical protein [Citrobacter freundii]